MTKINLDQPLVVDFVLRGDAFSKDGGDVIQARAYAQALSMLGDDVRLVEYIPGLCLRENAVIHYFNVDRPFEMLEVAQSAADRPFFISAIHHSAPHVRAMRKAQRSLPRQRISSLLPEHLRTLIVFTVRTAQDGRSSYRERAGSIFRSALRSIALQRCMRNIFEKSSGVFLLSERERLSLSTDFDWDARVGKLTPNGRPPIDFALTTKANRILVVGRIESRKRQLEIAKWATKTNIPLCFVGTPNTNEREYSEMFSNEIAANSGLEWLRGIPHNKVLELMQTSKVLLNCSWVEVQSLVDLEAAFSGCHVVTLENGGSSNEWLDNSVTEIPGSDIAHALRVARAFSLGDVMPNSPSYPHTWDSTTKLIRLEYVRVLKNAWCPGGIIE